MPPSIHRRTWKRQDTSSWALHLLPTPPKHKRTSTSSTLVKTPKTRTPRLHHHTLPRGAAKGGKKKSQTLILGLNGRSPRLNRIPKVSSLDRRVLVLSWQQPPVVPVLARRGQECGRRRSLDLRGPDVGGKSRPDLPGVQDGANSRGYVVFVFWLVGCGDPCSRGTTGRGGVRQRNRNRFCVGRHQPAGSGRRRSGQTIFSRSLLTRSRRAHSVSRPPACAHP